MEWKCIYKDRPEVGKWYVVVNKAGERMLRYYDLLYTEGIGSKKVISASWVRNWEWGWKKYECSKQIPFEGFVSNNTSMSGRLMADPYYFMELPPLPEISELDKCRSELYVLQQKIKRLEEATNA